METKPLYIMISRTDTGIGKLIRRFSGYPYNHVSLTLDPTFRRWVSFGRFVENAALYGGFIVEPTERYLAAGNRIDVRIFRLDIPADKHDRLTALFAMAGNPDSGLLYNTFDIVAAAIGRRIRIPDAYTCLGFACAILDLPFTTIKEMDEHMTPHLVYAGELAALVPDSGNRDDRFFCRLGAFRKTWVSARHLARLSARVLRGKHYQRIITN